MPEFDEAALEEFINQKLEEPASQPTDRRAIVEKLLNLSRKVGADKTAKVRGE